MLEDLPNSKRVLRDRYQKLLSEKWLREKPARSAALIKRNRELSERWHHLKMHGSGKPLRHPRGEYLTTEEVADRKNTSDRIVLQAIKLGWLPAEKPGKLWLIHPSDLGKWKRWWRPSGTLKETYRKRGWEE